MHRSDLVKINRFVLKILSGNEIMMDERSDRQLKICEYDQDSITNCRQTNGTSRKSHTTITRHQEDKLSKSYIATPFIKWGYIKRADDLIIPKSAFPSNDRVGNDPHVDMIVVSLARLGGKFHPRYLTVEFTGISWHGK